MDFTGRRMGFIEIYTVSDIFQLILMYTDRKIFRRMVGRFRRK